MTREQEIRERLAITKAKENAMWPAAMGYTEAAKYCRWHREDVALLLSIIDEQRERIEQLERREIELDYSEMEERARVKPRKDVNYRALRTFEGASDEKLWKELKKARG